MPLPIADYALLGDTRTAALVGRDGSVDWLCLPRFDSGACFAGLLGTPEHGRWLVAPSGEITAVTRAYRDGSTVLDTDFTTPSGAVRVTDCLVPGTTRPTLVRLVQGLSGRVPMQTELVLRFDYGAVVPWVRHRPPGLIAVAGPDAVVVQSPVPLRGRDFRTAAAFDVTEGQTLGFVLTHYRSHEQPPGPVDAEAAVQATQRWWAEWFATGQVRGEWAEAVARSAVTLKALTLASTGGLVAAPTTSLPEDAGGVRNWDYRFCWLRDATFSLYALHVTGFHEEAMAWRDWLLRAAAGRPEDLQILYGLAGERRTPELVLDWLPGYAAAAPVRVGNAARSQFQLDIYGEVLDALHLTRRLGHPAADDGDVWQLQRQLLEFLESAWSGPDSSLWEVRGPQRHFTHSKVMAWVGFDRAVKAVERFGRDGPVARWRELRDAVRRDVLGHGYDADRGTFVQAYGSDNVDAALLMLPLVGFLPATDPRMVGTVAAIEQDLLHGGFVRRYLPDQELDGMPGGEGAFLPCSFWLADNYALQGRAGEARALFERLLALRNDVGLLSEECDPATGALLGNFPQAFTHVALVNTAHNLAGVSGPASHRSSDDDGVAGAPDGMAPDTAVGGGAAPTG